MLSTSLFDMQGSGWGSGLSQTSLLQSRAADSFSAMPPDDNGVQLPWALDTTADGFVSEQLTLHPLKDANSLPSSPVHVRPILDSPFVSPSLYHALLLRFRRMPMMLISDSSTPATAARRVQRTIGSIRCSLCFPTWTLWCEAARPLPPRRPRATPWTLQDRMLAVLRSPKWTRRQCTVTRSRAAGSRPPTGKRWCVLLMECARIERGDVDQFSRVQEFVFMRPCLLSDLFATCRMRGMTRGATTRQC